jgi:hypothetical protein
MCHDIANRVGYAAARPDAGALAGEQPLERGACLLELSRTKDTRKNAEASLEQVPQYPLVPPLAAPAARIFFTSSTNRPISSSLL